MSVLSFLLRQPTLHTACPQINLTPRLGLIIPRDKFSAAGGCNKSRHCAVMFILLAPDVGLFKGLYAAAPRWPFEAPDAWLPLFRVKQGSG